MVKSHFRGGEERLIEGVEFKRSRFFIIVVIKKIVNLYRFAKEYVVYIVEHRIRSIFQANCDSNAPIDTTHKKIQFFLRFVFVVLQLS